jgi:ATP adenylyltransferase
MTVEIQPADQFAGTADGFERLWTPHRMAYIGGLRRPKTTEPDQCPFCQAPSKPVDEGLVVARGQTVYAVLNLFPYNTGHLLICPYRHVGELTDLTQAEAHELISFTRQAIIATRASAQPAGFNLGINQGAVAGAGIHAHLHQHVVPRWPNDANFFPIIGQTKAMPELLTATRQRLADVWPESDIVEN